MQQIIRKFDNKPKEKNFTGSQQKEYDNLYFKYQNALKEIQRLQEFSVAKKQMASQIIELQMQNEEKE